MHEGPDKRDGGIENLHRPNRPEIRPLSEKEGFAIAGLKLIAIALLFTGLWIKIDAFQQASINLINTIDQARIEKSKVDQQRSDQVLSEILARIQAMADKTDGIADATKKVVDQTLAINKTQTDLLKDLKNVTTAHTKDITVVKHEAIAAKSAAQKAAAQTKKTQAQVASPWYKNIFK